MMAKDSPAKGIFIVNKDNVTKTFVEEFNSKVSDPQVKFPKELGAEHPFNFEDMQKLYSKEGLVYGAVSRYVNAIIGEFSVNCEDERTKEILEEFLDDSNFEQVVRDWLIEAFVKGNGFMEIDFKENKLKVINANNMYVVRDKFGFIKGYNQYFGDIKKFNSGEVINFKPEQIAHIKINAVADAPYGLGILWPNERTIENIVLNEQQLHILMQRKAGAPIHFKIGQPGEAVNQAQITAVQQDLQYLTNKTEWVTDGNVDIKLIDFTNIGNNLTQVLDHDLLMFSYGTQIPESLMGKGNLPEGLAAAQTEDWNRLIASYQEIIESIVEDKIFNPILASHGLLKTNGLQSDVEFKWNLPTETEINNRILQLNTLVSNPNVDENLRRLCQLEIARLLGFKDVEILLRSPEQGLDQKQEDEQKKMDKMAMMKKNNVNQNKVIDVKESITEEITLKEFINMQELQNVNLTDYMSAILSAINKDDFTQLRAIQESDLSLGLLSESDIEKLRIILKNGFKQNQSIREIEAQIREQLSLKDRINESGELLLSKDLRPEMIARTETVRLANEGLINLYANNGIKEVQFLAASSDRTCEICQSLNGKIYSINESYGVIPVHPNCRCTFLSVIK